MLGHIKDFVTDHQSAILAVYFLILTAIEYKTLRGFKYTLRLLPWYFINELLVNVYVLSFFEKGLSSFESFRIFAKLPLADNLLVNFIFTFFIFEFTIYWVHYAFHNNEYLWNLHKVHHNTSEMTWSLTFKSHFLENFLFLFPPFVLVYIFDLNIFSVWIYQSLSFFWGIFVHAKHTRVFPPWVESVLNTMKAHHWHHYPSTIKTGGQNFGNLSLIYDRLFKTLHNPPVYPEVVGMSDYEVMKISVKEELVNPIISNYKKIAN